MELLLNENYMRQALSQARAAADQGEIPVGAVLVDENGCVLAATHNLTEASHSPLAHAEMLAVEEGCRKKGGWRLSDCTLYVTLEPCPMCMGASLNARVDKIFFGAYEQKGRSLTEQLADANLLNHKTEVVGGVLQEECAALLSGFFISMRQKQKEAKERAKAEAEALSAQAEKFDEKEI
jgi:tRNA(adenine34) deaminase